MTTRVCVVTGTRAEYGLLRPVMRGLDADDRFELQVVATGAHLSPEFGLTVTEDRGRRVRGRRAGRDAPVVGQRRRCHHLARPRDHRHAAGALDRLAPDLVLVLGDRYEILGVVQAALVARSRSPTCRAAT
jgi:GDP/UDP-N,N'-diacetylbacillosamine 2-epimerase (hydrolysing)